MNSTIKLGALAVALIAIITVYYFFFSQEVVAPETNVEEVPIENQIPEESAPTSVSISRTYSKGTHTVRGVISLPTPCYTLATDVEVSSTTEPLATIVFSSGDPGGMCIQVIDEREFEVNFKAPEGVALKGLLNGTEISLTESTE